MSTALTTTLGGLTLPTPVMTAAGFGGPELGRFVDLTTLGACVTRTITLDPWEGPTTQRFSETPSGILTDLGLENPGLQAFLAVDLPELATQQVRTIVSVAAHRLSDYAELARRAGGAPGVTGLEVCFAGVDAYDAVRALSVVRRDIPPGVAVLAKLPLGDGLVELARELSSCGADALVLGLPLTGLTLDPATLTAFRGGLAGPATAPLALEAVWRVHEALPDVPLVGVGGIRSGSDAVAMLAAGATAVQVGAALLRDPTAAHRVQKELADLLHLRGLKPADIVGIAHRGGLT